MTRYYVIIGKNKKKGRDREHDSKRKNDTSWSRKLGGKGTLIRAGCLRDWLQNAGVSLLSSRGPEGGGAGSPKKEKKRASENYPTAAKPAIGTGTYHSTKEEREDVDPGLVQLLK